MSFKKTILNSGIVGRGAPNKISGNTTVQAIGSTSSGAGAVDINIYVGNDDSTLILAGTISLVLGTTQVTDGFVISGAWPFIAAEISSISGTGANVEVSTN